MKRTAQRRPVAHYIILVAAFVVVCAYQIRAAREQFPQWFGAPGRANWPFLVFADDSAPKFTINFLGPNALRAGLHQGDTLLRINGHPVTGTAVFGSEIASAHAADAMRVEVRSNGATIQRIFILTPARNEPGWAIVVCLAMPVFCIVLGFWVAAIRPRDRLAWLLLAYLLGFATFCNPFVEFWGPVTRDLGAIYRIGLRLTWEIWLLLFAIYFPEPLSVGSRGRTFWKWVMWIVVVPLGFLSAAGIITSVGIIENYSSVFPLNHLIGQIPLLPTVCSYSAVAGSVACLAWKWRLAASPDSRRRLRLVFVGGLISFPVYLLLVLVAEVRHSNVERLFPAWLYSTSYLLLFVFPLAIAYAIVVQRAMDVRLIIRQSLQYTLARRGVIILQALLSAGLFALMAALMAAHTLSYVGTILLMAAGLWGIFLLNGITHRMAVLIDRRFFRETYNAEQILNELAENVRTIVETDSLLATVTRRISEALHVSKMAVLLDGSGPYRPAYALGYTNFPELVFTDTAPTIQHLRKEKQPVRVYFDDPNSWLYRSPAMSSDERERLAQLQTELLLPLLVKDQLIGFMSLGQKLSEAAYSGSDLGLLNSVATQTSLALEVSRLSETIAAEASQRERLNRELEIAREVQEKLFPHRLPSVPGVEYCGECRPAREVGGDYYDFIELPDGNIGIAIGDISGKGIGAALMMANLQASLRGQASVLRSMPELIKRVNGMVYEASSSNRYATFFYAEYDPKTGSVRYVNAGHNPPVVLRNSAVGCEVFRWEAGGPIIGLLPEVQYEEGTFRLQQGDLVVLFTDGISESMNSQDEEWGEESLIACIKTCCKLSAREALNRIMTEAISFASGAPQHDDMTLVVLRVGTSSI